jgi:hypothetical protein
MKYEDLIQQLKQRTGRFAVNGVVIRNRKGRKWDAFGSLSCADKRFVLELMTTERADLHLPWSTGILHQKDFWDISGTLEGRWRFRCRKIFPSSNSYGFNDKTTWIFRTPTLELIHGFEDLTAPALFRVVGTLPQSKLPIATEFTIVERKNSLETTTSHTDTVLSDQHDDYDYGLITEGNDLRFLFWSKIPCASLTPLKTKRQIDAIVATLSFFNGVDARLAWMSVTYRGKKWFERFSPAEQFARHQYVPFNEPLLVAGREKALIPFRKIQSFLATSPNGAEAATIQWLLRQVAGRSLRLRTLVASVLFERMVDVTYSTLPPSQSGDAESPFSSARRDVLNFIESRIREALACEQNAQEFSFGFSESELNQEVPAVAAITAYRRLSGALGMREKQTREKWKELSVHFGLRDCDDILDAWRTARPMRAHGGLVDDYSPSSMEQDLEQLSLITSGINILFLKMAGYAGPCTKWKIIPQQIAI